METILVVGLGNPGKKYERTRHNVGWIALDYIAEKTGVKISKIKFKATYGETVIDGKKFVFLKPQTFMNLSGEAVKAAADFYKIPPEKIIVISDDINLPSNVVRIRKSGRDGGHNGLASIIYMLVSDEFPRIRIGVSDRENSAIPLADWVLGTFSEEEYKGLISRLDDVYNAILLIADGKTDLAMSKYNG